MERYIKRDFNLKNTLAEQSILLSKLASKKLDLEKLEGLPLIDQIQVKQAIKIIEKDLIHIGIILERYYHDNPNNGTSGNI